MDSLYLIGEAQAKAAVGDVFRTALNRASSAANASD
jgi:hypothetical protein